ncbi:hypothetical protein [Actinomadura chibensis]|uniref:Uncharacterized protein n=1 Tax=Actinomadura chibensis TaxID=392828 RepID=A0A5D0NUB2_9ACTN|nr:hypothetical protein [Actinomadura chibensis]TYB47822.1 hypothetical protein FXF69_00765 [Actinomadura chibensis]
MDATGSHAHDRSEAGAVVESEPGTPATAERALAPSTEPDTLPATVGRPRPQHGRDGGKDPQQAFVATLLAVVTAYSTTGSIVLTVFAAVIALLVVVLIGRM